MFWSKLPKMQVWRGVFPGVWWGAQSPCFIVFGVSNPSDSAGLVPLMLEMRVFRIVNMEALKPLVS